MVMHVNVTINTMICNSVEFAELVKQSVFPYIGNLLIGVSSKSSKLGILEINNFYSFE